MSIRLHSAKLTFNANQVSNALPNNIASDVQDNTLDELSLMQQYQEQTQIAPQESSSFGKKLLLAMVGGTVLLAGGVGVHHVNKSLKEEKLQAKKANSNSTNNEDKTDKAKTTKSVEDILSESLEETKSRKTPESPQTPPSSNITKQQLVDRYKAYKTLQEANIKQITTCTKIEETAQKALKGIINKNLDQVAKFLQKYDYATITKFTQTGTGTRQHKALKQAQQDLQQLLSDTQGINDPDIKALAKKYKGIVDTNNANQLPTLNEAKDILRPTIEHLIFQTFQHVKSDTPLVPFDTFKLHNSFSSKEEQQYAYIKHIVLKEQLQLTKKELTTRFNDYMKLSKQYHKKTERLENLTSSAKEANSISLIKNVIQKYDSEISTLVLDNSSSRSHNISTNDKREYEKLKQEQKYFNKLFAISSKQTSHDIKAFTQTYKADFDKSYNDSVLLPKSKARLSAQQQLHLFLTTAVKHLESNTSFQSFNDFIKSTNYASKPRLEQAYLYIKHILIDKQTSNRVELTEAFQNYKRLYEDHNKEIKQLQNLKKLAIQATKAVSQNNLDLLQTFFRKYTKEQFNSFFPESNNTNHNKSQTLVQQRANLKKLFSIYESKDEKLQSLISQYRKSIKLMNVNMDLREIRAEAETAVQALLDIALLKIDTKQLSNQSFTEFISNNPKRKNNIHHEQVYDYVKHTLANLDKVRSQRSNEATRARLYASVTPINLTKNRPEAKVNEQVLTIEEKLTKLETEAMTIESLLNNPPRIDHNITLSQAQRSQLETFVVNVENFLEEIKSVKTKNPNKVKIDAFRDLKETINTILQKKPNSNTNKVELSIQDKSQIKIINTNTDHKKPPNNIKDSLQKNQLSENNNGGQYDADYGDTYFSPYPELSLDLNMNFGFDNNWGLGFEDYSQHNKNFGLDNNLGLGFGLENYGNFNYGESNMNFGLGNNWFS